MIRSLIIWFAGFKNSVSEMPNNTTMNGLGSSLRSRKCFCHFRNNILSTDKEFSPVIGMAHPNTVIRSYNYCINSAGLLSDFSVLLRNPIIWNMFRITALLNLKVTLRKTDIQTLMKWSKQVHHRILIISIHGIFRRICFLLLLMLLRLRLMFSEFNSFDPAH